MTSPAAPQGTEASRLLHFARNPVLAVGVILVLLGIGNWSNGKVKMAEYTALTARDTTQPAVESLAGFPYLTQRTNANLLRPLRSPSSIDSYAEGKVEFYRVVVSGGRLLVLFGLFLLIVGALWERRQRRRTHGGAAALRPT